MKPSLQLLSTKATDKYTQSVFEELCLFPEFYENYHKDSAPHLIKTKEFADGELEAVIDITLKGKNIFLFASSGRSHEVEDPSKAKMVLYHSIDAIKRAQPNSLVVFEPYCSPSRSDRTMGRNSVGLWIHYKFLMSLGVDKILTYQLHSDKSKTIIDPTISAIEDIPANVHMMEYITTHYIKSMDYLNSHVKDNWLFCSVDAGGEGFAQKFSKAFNTGLITTYKQRNYSKVNTVESVNILTATDLTDKEIWVVDDMIDTGGSVETLIRTLNKYKVKKVHLAVIHPVFSRPALEKLNRLYQQGLLHTVLVLDTIPHNIDYAKEYPFVRVVPSANLSAQIILRAHEQKSLSAFFEDFNIHNFLQELPYRQ